jgi:hypothetical protein
MLLFVILLEEIALTMPDSSNDEALPHQIGVSGPQSVEETGSEAPYSLPLSTSRYTNTVASSQARFSFSHPVLPMPQGHLDGGTNGSGEGDTEPPTAAMSVASLHDVPKSAARMERENFLLFIKILFKLLEEDNDPPTRSRAQRIVMECRRRNQQGDPNYTPLMDGIERHLRVFVGEAKWRRSHLLLHHYIATKRGMPGSSPGSTNRERPTAIMVGK